MNTMYRIIWSISLGTWVVVSELTKSRTKSKSQSNGVPALATGSILLPLLLLGPPNAYAQTPPAPTALPTGGQVVAGQAAIAHNGATMNITQGNNRAAINWQGFDIGSQATVNFNQPSASAVALNRVMSGNPSQIMGNLNANGQVFITNPNGIVFGKTANVNVGGLVATTHGISNEDFMAGNDHFTRNGATGAIRNEGKLQAGLEGYIALLAPEVRNNGVIIAQKGTVALAAGDAYSLQLDGTRMAGIKVQPATIKTLVKNKQAIEAPGGLIILSAKAANQLQNGVVKNSGTLTATSLTNKGGVIRLEGDRVKLSATSQVKARGTTKGGTIEIQAKKLDMAGLADASGTLDGGSISIQTGSARIAGKLSVDGNSGKGGTLTLGGDELLLANGSQLHASGATGGGEVLVGGDWQGSGAMPQASQVTMEQGASIDASATQKGDGGKVVLWSDIHKPDSATRAQGSVKAQGGAEGGNGGKVETSGHSVDIDGFQVDTLAAKGKAGLWLIDPYDYNIGATEATTIGNALNTSDVTVSTTTNNTSFGSNGNSGSTGNIVVNNAIIKNSSSDTTLTLQAHRRVLVTAPISSSNGKLNVVLWSGLDGQGKAGTSLGTGSSISTNGGHFWAGGSSTANGSMQWNGLTVGNGPSVGANGANYNALDLFGDITTSGGDVMLWAGNGKDLINRGIVMNANHTINAGSGDITLHTDRVAGGVLTINTTGHLTYKPNGNAFGNPDAGADLGVLNFTGTTTNNIFTGNSNDDIRWLKINNFSSLGGLTLGKAGITSSISIDTAIGINGPISLYGQDIIINAALSTTGAGSDGNIFLQANNDVDLKASSGITNSGNGESTLTLRANRRVLVNAPISGSNGKLNVVLWSDYANQNSGGVTIGKNITTNGGHFWAGGSSTANGSMQWNGLTVGDGPSVGSGTANNNGMDLVGNITTSGGDVMLWAGNGLNPINRGILMGGTQTIDAGSGNITLRTDRIFPQVGSGLTIKTTGHFTYESNSNTFHNSDSGGAVLPTLNFNGTTSNNIFTGTNDANWLKINNFSNLGGLTIGKAGNASGIAVNSAIGINGPISLYGQDVTVNAPLSTTGAGGNGDILLQAYKADSSGGDIQVNSTITKSGSDTSTLTLKASRNISVNTGANITSTAGIFNQHYWADSDNSGDGINQFTANADTKGGWLKFGNNQTATINGVSTLVGGDVFFNGSSAQVLNTGGGQVDIYGETIVANSHGLTINSAGGDVRLHGVLNSGNRYNFIDKTTDTNHDWDWARNDAKNGTAGGSAVGDSYLVNIGSRLENSIAGLAAGYKGAWIGAYRPDPNSYAWKWADGPESGQQFFTQTGSGSNSGGGTTATGFYSNFGSGEPNGALGTNRDNVESVGQFFGTAGSWNDLNKTTTFSATQSSQYAVLGYVRETNLANSSLTINAGSGNFIIDGSVGANKPLSTLSVQAASTTINGNAMVTSGAQSYNNALTVNANGHLNISATALNVTDAGALLFKATGDISLNAPTTVNGSARIEGANIALNKTLTATNNSITLKSTGNVTQSAALTANQLLLQGGNVTLTNDGNQVGTLAASGVVNLNYLDSDALTIGTVDNTAGVSASGTLEIATKSGDLTLAEQVQTTNTTAAALTLNAGKDAAAGTAAGGNLIISGSPDISVGSGGTAKLFTGSISDSTGLTGLVDSGSGRFRYNSDEITTNYTKALIAGLNAIYRERPAVTVNGGTHSLTYGDDVSGLAASVTAGALVNGDTAGANITGRQNSTSGNIKAGSYAVATDVSDLTALGYNATGSNGTLTVATKGITISGITATNKVYDGNNNASLNTGSAQFAGMVSGDALDVSSATGTFDNKNVGDGKTVNITGITLNGADAGNYNLTNNTATTTANISRLDSVTWVGGPAGNWFDPSNWAGGAVPDLSNVANVVIPDGVNVSFDTSAATGGAQTGTVQIDSLGGATGSLTQSNGALSVGAGGISLHDLSQSGGTLESTGPIRLATLAQTGGAITAGNGLTVSTDFSQGTSGSIAVTGDTSITDTSGGMTLGNLSVTGDLTASSTDGAISQSGGPLLVTGTTSLNAGTADIRLDDPDNDFGGEVSASGHDVTLADSNSLTLGTVHTDGNLTLNSHGNLNLGTSTVQGNLNANSGNGTISQSGPLVVDGTSNLQSGTGDIRLNNAGNDFGGAVSASGDDVTLTDSNSLTLGTVHTDGNLTLNSQGNLNLGTSTVQGNLNANSGNGTISQNGPLVVDGSSNLQSGTGDIRLNNAGNDFGGAVSASGNNVTLTDSNSLTLGTVHTDGNLTLNSQGNLNLGTSTVQGNLNANSGNGNISQNGPLVVNGASYLNAGSGLILLPNPQNQLSGGVYAQASYKNIAGDLVKNAEDLQTTLHGTESATLAWQMMHLFSSLLVSDALASTPASSGWITEDSINMPMGSATALGSIKNGNAILLAGATDSSPQNSGNTVIMGEPLVTDAGIIVLAVKEPSAQIPGVITVTVPRKIVSAGTGFNFPLPPEVIADSGPDTVISVQLANGNPLPDWLQFDVQTRTFSASSVPDGALPLNMVVIIGDRRYVIEVSQQKD